MNVTLNGPLRAAALLAALAACDPAPTTPAVAETSAAAAKPAAAMPAAAGATRFAIDRATSEVDFLMDAPVEKIRGRMHGGAEGDLQIDLGDLSKTAGVIALDVGTIEVFQTKADDSGKFGEETKSDKQNEHVRNWLEISPDTPAEARAKNARATFTITSVEVAGEKDVTKMSGAERKVALTAKGNLALHGHEANKVAELEATFRFDGDKPVSVTIKSARPFGVSLVDHDVKPRDAFGKLALKTLDALSSKVAKEANVTVQLTAVPANTIPAKAP